MKTQNKVRFYLARLKERLWIKPLISCVLSLVAVFIAVLAEQFEFAWSFPNIREESLKELLSIMAASMLVIAVFTVGSMLAAYGSASNSATPRSFPLVIGDDVSQNALSTFIGAFIFSVVALLTLMNGFYAQPGRFILFIITIFVFALVVLGFVRWVDRIARLGQMDNTIEKVETATDDALKLRAQLPTMGAVKATSTGEGIAVYPKTVGYVQNIDAEMLQKLAEKFDGKISVSVLPGAFVTPAHPLAYFTAKNESEKDNIKAIAESFEISDHRSFESDPRFGLIALSEIASRALSAAVNDPGTAIDIVGTFVRLFVRWQDVSERNQDPQVQYDRIEIRALSLDDMFDDAFNAIARDGASNIEVAIRLQKAFHSLILNGDNQMRQTAIKHSTLALKHSEQSLKLKEEFDAVRALAERNMQSSAANTQGQKL